jgi:hypothetical protein
VFIIVSIPTRLLRTISGGRLEQLYYSPIGPLLVKGFTVVSYAKKGKKPYQFHDIMMNIDISKPDEGLSLSMLLSL